MWPDAGVGGPGAKARFSLRIHTQNANVRQKYVFVELTVTLIGRTEVSLWEVC